MIKKWVYALMLLSVLAGCSNTAATNKANLDDEVFEKGTKLVQYTYMEVVDEEVPEEELKEILKWFSDKLESGEYASEEEELFFAKMELIKHKQGLNALRKFSGGPEVSIEEFEETFNEIEEKFGIPYKK